MKLCQPDTYTAALKSTQINTAYTKLSKKEAVRSKRVVTAACEEMPSINQLDFVDAIVRQTLRCLDKGEMFLESFVACGKK